MAKCENCGSDNLVSGQVNTSLGFLFIPDAEIKKQPKQGLACDICRDCGHIQNWHITNPGLI